MKATDNKTLWAKIGSVSNIAIMSKTILFFGRGCVLKFFDLSTNNVIYHTINSRKGNGAGLKCYAGHSSIQIFAYAESCPSPNIYMKSYPDFQVIAKFPGQREGFTYIAFSETSLLFTMGEKPNYTMTAWNWRTLSKFAEYENAMLYERQMFKCSYGRPMYLAQLGVGSNRLFIWDVFTVCQTSLFAKHEVKIGQLKPDTFQDEVWSADGVALFVIDAKGCIYTYDRDFQLEEVVTFSEPGEVTPSICWYHHGLMVSGPTQEIRFYRKNGAEWSCHSRYPTVRPVYEIICVRYEKCIGTTDLSNIVTFGIGEDSFNVVQSGDWNYQNMCIINPMGEFLAGSKQDCVLDLLDIGTGELVSTITTKKAIRSMAEHPGFPFLATGHEGGFLKLVSFYNAEKPTILTVLSLADFDLDTVKFFEQGHILVTGNNTLGEYFILRGLPGTQIEVLVHVQVGRQVADYAMVASQTVIRFFAIPVTHRVLLAGHQVWRYCIVDGRLVNVKVFEFENEQSHYARILPKRGQDRDRTFYLIPINARYMEVAETKRGNHIVCITDRIKTGHQIKRFEARFTTRHFLTYGYDGFAFVRNADTLNIEAMTLSHDRANQGVRCVAVNPSANVLITLGFDNVMMAVEVPFNPDNEELLLQLEEQMTSPKMALMFKRPTLCFHVEERFAGKCWKEIKALKIIEQEHEMCKVEKMKILKEFQDIQNTLQELVTDNLSAPDNKKLDLLEFYLDTATYQKKQQQNKVDCKEMETNLKQLIIAQDKVSDYIIKTYYEPMGVKWQNIMGIFSAVKATNYCLLPENEYTNAQITVIEEQRKVEQYLSGQDTFEPWQTMTKEELEQLLKKRPTAPKDDYTGIAAILSFKEENEMIDDTDKYEDTRIAWAGSVSQLYIDISPGHYKQRQMTTFYQSTLQESVVECEELKLKKRYNKAFLDMRAVKEREMYNIREKNARLRHIVSEFNYFSDKKVNVDIVDPEWDPYENVETAVLRVSDNEIPVRPYVSPSEQAILDAKAAEAERIRLLLLADDFRERALMAMMNGVLEVRWEDELRIEVPKPKCMTDKLPEEYNEEDLRALRDYEEKVAQLKTDREKYKSLLEVEFGKLSTAVRESIRKFNVKLYDCTKLKFYIDSGMNQENLSINRQRVIQNGRIEYDYQEREILKKIKMYEKDVEENQKFVVATQEAIVECRNNMDSMMLRDKQLEKAYRKEFQDMSPVVQEQSYKLYKKRPKASFRLITIASVLHELARAVITNEITFTMTPECVEYLKALDQFDAFVGLPPTIEENVWQLLCKHRRLRIEHEIRYRAAQLQIADGEATTATFQKRVAIKKERIVSLQAELDQTRADRLRLIHNKQLQFVLRRGLVEIPLSGDLKSDFLDAILVPKTDIEHVNNLIVEAGKLKLKTIMQNLKFKRTMMSAEWEHTRLRMRINDLIEQKKDIDNVKFTKEMQSYLKNKSLGRKQEMESYEVEVELLAAAYENRIKDKKDKVKKIQRQLKTYLDSNKELDRVIREVNIDLCHYKLEKDYEIEDKETEILQLRMRGMLKRNQLVKKMQENHNEILVLQAELELLRLRTFPTFKYKILDD